MPSVAEMLRGVTLPPPTVGQSVAEMLKGISLQPPEPVDISGPLVEDAALFAGAFRQPLGKEVPLTASQRVAKEAEQEEGVLRDVEPLLEKAQRLPRSKQAEAIKQIISLMSVTAVPTGRTLADLQQEIKIRKQISSVSKGLLRSPVELREKFAEEILATKALAPVGPAPVIPGVQSLIGVAKMPQKVLVQTLGAALGVPERQRNEADTVGDVYRQVQEHYFPQETALLKEAFATKAEREPIKEKGIKGIAKTIQRDLPGAVLMNLPALAFDVLGDPLSYVTMAQQGGAAVARAQMQRTAYEGAKKVYTKGLPVKAGPAGERAWTEAEKKAQGFASRFSDELEKLWASKPPVTSDAQWAEGVVKPFFTIKTAQMNGLMKSVSANVTTLYGDGLSLAQNLGEMKGVLNPDDFQVLSDLVKNLDFKSLDIIAHNWGAFVGRGPKYAAGKGMRIPNPIITDIGREAVKTPLLTAPPKPPYPTMAGKAVEAPRGGIAVSTLVPHPKRTPIIEKIIEKEGKRAIVRLKMPLPGKTVTEIAGALIERNSKVLKIINDSFAQIHGLPQMKNEVKEKLLARFNKMYAYRRLEKPFTEEEMVDTAAFFNDVRRNLPSELADKYIPSMDMLKGLNDKVSEGDSGEHR